MVEILTEMLLNNYMSEDPFKYFYGGPWLSNLLEEKDFKTIENRYCRFRKYQYGNYRTPGSLIVQFHNEFPQLAFDTILYVVCSYLGVSFGFFKKAPKYAEEMEKIHYSQNIVNVLRHNFSSIIISMKVQNSSSQPIIYRNKLGFFVDLHGCDISKICILLEAAINSASRSSKSNQITVVSGKGNHSKETGGVSLSTAICIEFVNEKNSLKEKNPIIMSISRDNFGSIKLTCPKQG